MRKIKRLTIFILIIPIFSITVFAASGWRGGDVYRGGGKGVVALTFDDGPHETKTDEILSILDEYGVKATFFMVGKNVAEYPEIASRVIGMGHEVGNHTFSHKYLFSESLENIIDEIESENDLLLSISEYKPHFLRPPGGIYDCSVIKAAEKEEMVIAMWTIDTLDWCQRSTEDIVFEVLENVGDGDIILMHDYIYGTSHTAEALRIIIPELLKRGYSFVTLSDMYLNHR